MSIDDLAGRGLDEAHDGHGHDAFAAAAFADDAQGAFAGQTEVDTVNGAHGASFEKEIGLEILDF